ncbi:phosphoserine phosphatase SerB [uncultured Litoreibacter sp.]|uniref:phosphoserine phosphatase SerB n=1 Tax=uncultured Litoreibacter sp. TaxID=1392394 RepID=UPI0026350CC9|nr:phosphoserine phosphatase SerB [uncultured Litoreibacter sp.]
MFVASLLTNPETPVLEPALIESLRNAWGGGDAVWLMPDVAAEFGLASVPDNLDSVWADLQELKVDVLVHPSTGRKKRLLLADMDSTMIQQECIDELADYAGVGAQVAGITARAMNGEIEFEGALRERVGLLKGLDQAVLESVLAERITYMPGGKTLLATMKASGGYAALVSGGFTAFTGPVAEHLGFDEHRSNKFVITDGVLTGDVIPPIFGKEAKVEALDDLTAKLGLTDDEVLAVGDGANDLGMLTRAGMGVALHAKPSVQAQADFRVNHGDLTALLFLQGYSAEEFVS